MKKNRIQILITIAILLSCNLQAQDFTKIGTSAAQFLKIPVGAKATAMAGTFAAIVDDPSAMYWNPAGISQQKKFQVYVSHTQWIADIDHNFFGLTVPVDDQSTFGINAITLASGDIERTTIENPQGTGTYFDATDLAVGISYARYLIEDISVGVNIKYIQQRIWNTSAETFAADFGILLHTGFYGLTLGLSFQNFGADMQMKGSDLIRTVDQDENSTTNPLTEAELQTEKYVLPVNYRASIVMPLVGVDAPFNIALSSLLVSIDGVHFNENYETYSVGMEYGYADVLFLRSGYRFNTDEEGLTLGTGLKIEAFSSSVNFDYAYSDFGVFSAVHTFSVGLGL
ncbi:MAG: PorV/PorQ family protein [Ignavibacteria bacterium]|jgi:hypothetical protein